MEKFFAFLRPTPCNEFGKIKKSYLIFVSDPDMVGGQYNGYVAVHKSTKFYQKAIENYNKACKSEECVWSMYDYAPNVSVELTFSKDLCPGYLEDAMFLTEMPEISLKMCRGIQSIFYLSDWYIFGFDTMHTYNRWSVDTFDKVKKDTLNLLEEIKSYED